MAWGWSIMTGSLLLKVGAARFAERLQQKRASLSQWITYILVPKLARSEAFSVAIVTTGFWAVIGGTWVLFNY
jgi:hypothetical protein